MAIIPASWLIHHGSPARTMERSHFGGVVHRARVSRTVIDSRRRPMTRAAVLIFVGVQVAVFGMVAKEAYSLSMEIATLKQRIAATALAEREAALKDECVGSIWPNIPLQCLKRIPPSHGRVDE